MVYFSQTGSTRFTGTSVNTRGNNVVIIIIIIYNILLNSNHHIYIEVSTK